ncbi:MAG: bacteriohemerythrin [Thermodesulfobacteriota bacterium]
MALIDWSGNLSVKVAEIDQQHQKLVAMINEIHEAMKQGRGKNVLGPIINELVNYTKTHFTTEEKYFDQFKYPQADIHKAKHKEFVKKVSEFKAGFDKGSLSLTVEVMNFLKDWLSGHIAGDDKKYGPFFNEKGLK